MWKRIAAERCEQRTSSICCEETKHKYWMKRKAVEDKMRQRHRLPPVLGKLSRLTDEASHEYFPLKQEKSTNIEQRVTRRETSKADQNIHRLSRGGSAGILSEGWVIGPRQHWEKVVINRSKSGFYFFSLVNWCLCTWCVVQVAAAVWTETLSANLQWSLFLCRDELSILIQFSQPSPIVSLSVTSGPQYRLCS